MFRSFLTPMIVVLAVFPHQAAYAACAAHMENTAYPAAQANTDAVWNQPGVEPRFLRIALQTGLQGEVLPGVVNIYARSKSAEPTGNGFETLVATIVPFSPVSETGLLSTTLQLPDNLKRKLASGGQTIEIVARLNIGSEPEPVNLPVLSVEIVR